MAYDLYDLSANWQSMSWLGIGTVAGGLMLDLAGFDAFSDSARALRRSTRTVNTAEAIADCTGRICFVAGTRVKTPDGFKEIEDIREGDLVWSRDEQTGEEGWKEVVETYITHPNELIHLTYGDDEQVIGTAEHPFWVVEAAGWQRLGDVQPGDTLVLDDGSHATVTAKWSEQATAGETFTTYNFEVADWHTYFVAPANDIDDDGFVWVHNTCSKLNQSLRAAGVTKEVGEEAHHIIPKGAMSGYSKETRHLLAKAKKIMSNHGIDIDSHWNGIYLKRQSTMGLTNRQLASMPSDMKVLHNGLHTRDYIEKVSRRIIDAHELGGKGKLLKEFQDIKYDMTTGVRFWEVV